MVPNKLILIVLSNLLSAIQSKTSYADVERIEHLRQASDALTELRKLLTIPVTKED